MAASRYVPPKPGTVEYYWEHVRGGWACLRSDNGEKVCVLNTESHRGLMRDGALIMEPVDRDVWLIHFTSALLYVEDLKQILASMPTEA